jgi:hypothetical protein
MEELNFEPRSLVFDSGLHRVGWSRGYAPAERVKRPGHEADHSHLLLRMRGVIPPLPHIFLWRLAYLIKPEVRREAGMP